MPEAVEASGQSSWLSRHCALVHLLNTRADDRVIKPKKYLAASHEVFALTLLICWAITLIYDPTQATKHPARPIIGSMNPCFGWDYAPASYVALVLCSVNVYLTWRYATLSRTRTNMMFAGGSSGRVEMFSNAASWMLAYSSNLWLLLWMVGPNAEDPGHEEHPKMKNWIVHTGIFVVYGVASFLAALGNYLEVRINKPEHVMRKHTVFIVSYGLSISYLGAVYGYDLGMYRFGEEPALNPYFAQAADFVWMGCVAVIAKYLPPEPPLHITIEIYHKLDEEDEKHLSIPL
mmetsp:Transcript_24427/g.44288  ORF Transcript_24427/g.44288 Transcript_24427/m.44288 type:complete len:290 (-) Transcript_24427:65-934(-)|eukprot:CAMPEP_0197659642 /NCGR_PEP_ID=MMETSP1338-20131121/48518_1 /TAXON_ID=43686 ORGANISM="Pelagodinium beii, Strain RCC1491" /NCGR_SAMPLE_ID=MMETSP1338 /ASSEMBLY_ACC=CAM_ASM_000754 /LENGTH=289 /DNA_ID=CAMNT_0043236665 /DNA_START=88 /DNA_END=957 /DNA_ORIENTATION=+